MFSIVLILSIIIFLNLNSIDNLKSLYDHIKSLVLIKYSCLIFEYDHGILQVNV